MWNDGGIMSNEWIVNEEGYEYKNIRKNGHWEVFRWRGDIAYYSFCPFCGYIHCCYKNYRDEDGYWKIEYAPEKEFNYCPMCGEDMENNKENEYNEENEGERNNVEKL